MSRLKSLHQKDKRAYFTFEDTSFKCELRFLRAADITKINERATKPVFDRDLGAEIDKQDPEIFSQEVAKHCLVGWEGLTFETVVNLLPLDESGLDLKEEIEYSQEDALELMAEAPRFTSWVLERVRDLENFRLFAD